MNRTTAISARIPADLAEEFGEFVRLNGLVQKDVIAGGIRFMLHVHPVVRAVLMDPAESAKLEVLVEYIDAMALAYDSHASMRDAVGRIESTRPARRP